jgi:cation transport protein ChaC
MQTDPLTRDLIESGAIDAMVARDAPALRLLTSAERRDSLQRTLAGWPSDDVWLFGYGSLIWNPTVDFVERRVARVTGWHRSFCLETPAGRGSVDNPGLVLGLDEGGDCAGLAFRLAADRVEAELTLLWQREMLSGAYVPRWLDLLDAQGHRFAAGLAFTINCGSKQYAGRLARTEVVRRLATATGALGSSADYLFRTGAELRRYGIADPELDRLEADVAAAQASLSQGV